MEIVAHVQHATHDKVIFVASSNRLCSCCAVNLFSDRSKALLNPPSHVQASKVAHSVPCSVQYNLHTIIGSFGNWVILVL